jgi:hypothetical protein
VVSEWLCLGYLQILRFLLVLHQLLLNYGEAVVEHLAVLGGQEGFGGSNQ